MAGTHGCEVLSLPCANYLDEENSYTVIEWPEIVYNLLKESSLSDKILYAFLNYCEDDLSVRELEIKNC